MGSLTECIKTSHYLLALCILGVLTGGWGLTLIIIQLFQAIYICLENVPITEIIHPDSSAIFHFTGS